jgi:hypothetical protein
VRAWTPSSSRRAPGLPWADSLAALDAKLAALAGAGGDRFGGGRGGAGAGGPTSASINGQLGGLHGLVEGTDAAPTTQAVRAAGEAEHALAGLLGRWGGLKRQAAEQAIPVQ